MHTRILSTHSQIRFSIFLLTVLLSLFATKIHATEVAEPSSPLGLTDEKSTMSGEEYTYQLENRKDPFVPFISPRATTTDTAFDPNEIIDENDVILTGMQLFEPGQLNLVAILSSGNKSIAMVEDVTGKGYILDEGILIGRRGVVSEILPNSVKITETAKTRAGKEIKSTITMKLNKEGDE